MFAITALTLLTTAGVGFYTRFLVALCKDARLFKTCYLVRLETGPYELQVIEQPEADDSLPLAA
ncbi:MAG TPA: hypothetical protein VK466_11355 [Terriglobales bacterium]|nr:hypothetical protein [Terriglobales bacterium]